MPWVREETKLVLLLIAYGKFLSASDCLSLHFGLPASGLHQFATRQGGTLVWGGLT